MSERIVLHPAFSFCWTAVVLLTGCGAVLAGFTWLALACLGLLAFANVGNRRMANAWRELAVATTGSLRDLSLRMVAYTDQMEATIHNLNKQLEQDRRDRDVLDIAWEEPE